MNLQSLAGPNSADGVGDLNAGGCRHPASARDTLRGSLQPVSDGAPAREFRITPAARAGRFAPPGIEI